MVSFYHYVGSQLLKQDAKPATLTTHKLLDGWVIIYLTRKTTFKAIAFTYLLLIGYVRGREDSAMLSKTLGFFLEVTSAIKKTVSS